MMMMLTCLLMFMVEYAYSRQLHPRQYDPSNPVNCKEVSFTAPEWYLYDPNYTVFNYTTGGTHGDVGLGAYNVATNLTFDCYARGVDLTRSAEALEWHNCSVPATEFSFSLATNSFGLRQRWICDNAPQYVHEKSRSVPSPAWMTTKRRDRFTFAANGTVELPDTALGCNTESGQKWCLYGGNSIRPGLTSPLTIRPFPPWLPGSPYEYPERCVERSDYPTWEIRALEYEHHGAIQFLSFNYTNMMNGIVSSCSLPINETLTRGTSHLARWIPCSTLAPSSSGEISDTFVQFDADYGILALKQNWKCHDNNVNNDEPEDYYGLGYLVTPLQCSEWLPYGGEMTGDAADYTCTLPTTNISGYASYDLPLPVVPHTSYTTSCTLNSMNNTVLRLQAYAFDFPADTPATASVTVFNPGPGDTYAIQDIPLQADGQWHTCATDTAGSVPWQLQSCAYFLNSTSGSIGFKFQWYCDDRDPFHA